MIRGEVWTVASGDRRWRVVVLSAEAFNVGAGEAYCVPIVRRPPGELPPYAVPLAETDPVAGVVLVATLGLVSAELGTERVGYLTGASLARIGDVLRDLFELSPDGRQ